jgi:DNA polymerase-3 subunit gamma/tau
MTYLALARKWRPQTFRDIIGQPTIVRTLSNAIEQERIHHAYLFSGVRGVGKTTTARILAKALNCVNGPTIEPCNQCSPCREITEGIDLDVREIDAATYTQVDNIRELREVTQFQPARDRYRIFIIDEAHMLSAGAWNALLKLIEEPPPHVIFMMATTELQKVPATILSRVQQFLFRKITPEEVAQRLEEICRVEGIGIDPQALAILAVRGEGSARDSLSLLDQIVAFSGRTVTAEDVVTILGISDTRLLARLISQIQAGDPAGLLSSMEEAAHNGRDFKLLYRDLLGYLRSMLVLASGGDEGLISVAGEELETMRSLAGQFDSSELLRLLNLLIRDDELISRSEQQRLAVEIAVLKAATLPRLRAVESLLNETQQSPGASPAQRKAPPARSETAIGASTRSAGGTTEAATQFIEKVRQQRKAAATYLEQARRATVEEQTLTFEYEPESQFAVDYLSETKQLEFLNELAHPLTVRIRVVGKPLEERKPERRITDDPVIKAFAKHLGGEIVS